MSENALVIAEQIGGVGQLTLNRPQAINALNAEMIGLVREALQRWESDDAVRTIVLRGAGERGFCAGGDVRAVRSLVLDGDLAAAGQYFRDEYALDLLMGTYPKPVVALMTGATMGGGVGLAGHASVRVVTETSRVAMPETRIGFTPDVGGTLLLARAPGRLGEFFGLTGESMNAGDALHCGFADVFVPEDSLEQLVAALGEADAAASAVADAFAQPAPVSHLDRDRAWIDACFAGETVRDILDALALRPERRATRTYTQLRGLSPTALALTLDGVRESRALDALAPALAAEYRRVVWSLTSSPDFVEGVRAVLVDKSHDPSWSPALRSVTDWAALAAPARAFAPPHPLFP